MDSTKYGNALEFDVDLHSIYAAYLGQFEAAGLDWWDKSWGGYFATFNDFLGFGWEVMVVVDGRTGRSHIAVRREQIALFAKMIRTRFGESLAKDPPTTLPLSPVPTRTLSLRRLITLPDLAAYRKLSLTLPAAELSHLRYRARSGDVEVAEQLFYAGGPSSERERGSAGMKDNGVGYTFACVRTTWWEKGGSPAGLIPGTGRTQGGRAGPGGQQGKGLVLEVGLAVLRCANLRAVDVWPPTPAENYRKSHFIIEEWVDKRPNQNPPTYPRAYAFGRSQFIVEKDVERILDANLAALASHDNDSTANTLIFLTLGEPAPLPVTLNSTLPNNILHVDVLAVEYNLLRRAQEQGVPGTPDRHAPLTSLSALLQTLQIPVPHFAPLGNAGNEAYYTLLAFQKLMMAQTRLPDTLFKGPDSVMHAGIPGMPAFGYGMPHSTSTAFPAYQPSMPPPQAPFARPTHDRRGSSSSSRRQSEMFQAPPRTSSPQSAQTRNRPNPPSGRTSDEPRPRPASFAEPGGSGFFRGMARESSGQGHARNGMGTSPITPEEELAVSGSAPSTLRQPGRGPITRSSTIFWDDAEYADSDVSSPKRQEASMRDQQRLRPTHSHNTGVDAERQRESVSSMRGQNPPPSAMRHNTGHGATNGNGSGHGQGTLNSAISSRTVSWSEEGPRLAASDNSRERSADRRSTMYRNGSSGSNIALNGNGGSMAASPSKQRMSSLPRNGSGLALGSNYTGEPQMVAGGSGSSTLLDSYSGSEARNGGPQKSSQLQLSAQSQQPDQPRKGSKEPVPAKKEKEGKEGKLKSEKSMRNVAGALARFWVG